MIIEKFISTLAYGIFFVIIFTIIFNILLFYVIKKIDEKTFLFFNAVVLLELSFLLIVGLINIIFILNYSYEEKLSTTLTLLILILIFLNISVSVYKKSKSINSEKSDAYDNEE